MPTFDELFTKFQQTVEICGFCEKYSANNDATRFLLIRSLDKPNLVEVLSETSSVSTDGGVKDLFKKVYESSVTTEQLLRYIEGKRGALIEKRQRELESLPELLTSFPVVSCGVRDDNVDGIIKSVVRDKSQKTYEALTSKVDEVVLPKVKQYILWSFYNQTANDIIELFFLQHPKVIPTLRKIPNIDFFLKIGDQIVPFDLKVTHISDSYFDLVSQGIKKTSGGVDDFEVTSEFNKELKTIRDYYSEFRKSHPELSLERPSDLSKFDIVSILNEHGSDDDKQFVTQMEIKHSAYVPHTSTDLHILEWWNYKYQGARLFCNNNRFFVFLAFSQLFTDGRELKGQTEEIGRLITTKLDSISLNDIHDIHYYYDEEAKVRGAYCAKSISIIYSK